MLLFRTQICFLALALVGISNGKVRADLEDLVITEIQASNDATITDLHGDYPDWVEVFHDGSLATDIGGCYLTDDPRDLTKWRFPSRILEEREFLVVFCSGKDLREPDDELHTNFGLSRRGEFLALVAPDGRTLLSTYSPTFPSMPTDFSYGFQMEGNTNILVDRDSPLRVFVPRSIHSGFASSLAWTSPGFFDGDWREGSGGVGYDTETRYLPLIDTDVRAELEGINASLWIRIPFTVGAPTDVETLTLRLKYDDGLLAYINGTLVADDLAPSSPGTWNEAAEEDRDDELAEEFRSWEIPANGLLQSGTNLLAIHGLNCAQDSSDFLVVAELDAFRAGVLNETTREFFDFPTPGTGNVPGYPGISPTPTLTPSNQLFVGTTTVTMTVPNNDAEIRYTLDRTVPTSTSSLYAGPLTISSSTFIRARSFTPGLAESTVVAGNYMTIHPSVATRSSSVPIVVIDTSTESIPGTNSSTFGPAMMAVFDRAPDGRSSFENAPDIFNLVGIRVRGSTSALKEKKSYRFEFQDDNGKDLGLEPLGLPEDSDWILYAGLDGDHTYMRNPFIYSLSRQIGRYASRMRFVELYLNTDGGTVSNANYHGVYSLGENLKRGDDRIDVERLDPSMASTPDTEGGYILKHDRADPDGSGLFFAGGVGVQFVYPDDTDTNEEQRDWIREHLDEALTTDNFMEMIDPLAAVDHHMLNALAKNADAFRLSGYLHKPRDGKVTFGPIWDFDLSMDSLDSRDDDWDTWSGPPDASLYFEHDERVPYWSRWLENPNFLQLWIDRWFEHRRGPFATSNIQAMVDSMRDELTESAARDAARWNNSIWSGRVDNLRNWLSNRVEWIDDQWLEPVEFSRSGGPIPPGSLLTLQSSNGTIFFTRDGSDPRLPGGALSNIAETYVSPVTLNANARVVARSRNGMDEWSAARAETFVVETPPLVITEIHFHPTDPDISSIYKADDFEFIELFNRGTAPIDLAGARLSGGIDFTFTEFVTKTGATLPAGERVVIVNDLSAFTSAHNTSGVIVAGAYRRDLSNSGDHVVFEGPLLEPIHDFQFSDSWSPFTDGFGHSLTILDPLSDLATWADGTSWVASTVQGGTPGFADAGIEGPGGRQIPGDANQDGSLDIGDAVRLAVLLFVNGQELPCDGENVNDGANVPLMDLNDSGEVGIDDALFLLNFLFAHGPAANQSVTCQRIGGCPHRCEFR